MSFQRSEVEASQAQLQPSTWVTSYLPLQLDQFDCGDDKARLGLSSATWNLAANNDSGNQQPLSQELGLDASTRMKIHPKLDSDALEGWAASKHGFALKQKVVKRKLLFSKWRLTCTFPGLQLRVLRDSVAPPQGLIGAGIRWRTVDGTLKGHWPKADAEDDLGPEQCKHITPACRMLLPGLAYKFLKIEKSGE
ncbi:hypothetical protein HPG69_006113 [Diceros bicornis minor]|uniref:Uncharacterized protein n=1 Tax=Diceros bicornis minor TaxID=77932 RepID=A0A7J7ERB0_DICBM|nr:hypothetical protein HPG69_006113 [Diceros bicornis minor]